MESKEINVFKEPKNLGEPVKVTGVSAVAMDVLSAPGKRNVPFVTVRNEQEEAKWHDFQTALYSGKILTGMVAGTQAEGDQAYAIVMCNDTQVFIPVEDMGLVNASSISKSNDSVRLTKLAGAMMMAEVDFVVTKVEREKDRVLASRAEAMKRRCERFYFGSVKQIYPGRVVEARVVGVSQKSVRVEVYGVLAKMDKKELTRAFIADCSEVAKVGQRMLVYVEDVRGSKFENVSVSVNAVMVTEDNTDKELNKLKMDGRYLGKVTGISGGIYFIRLSIGCNVACHKCLTSSLPTVGDHVAVVIKFIDMEKKLGRGIVTQLLGAGD